ncbi:MAG: glycosyltransferase [Geobacter sp.]|nr:glycosyltransferase [Geobacter sp.]
MQMDFTIIIPAKNEEKYISMCLDSINAMDTEGLTFEVIVVDNGSTDKTVSIAKAKGATVFEKPDLTISALRNFGATQAAGDILAFLDADCTVDNKWLKNALVYKDQNEVVSFGSPAVIPENATWVQTSWFAIREKKCQIQEVNWHESANVFVLKKAFEEVGGFDETLITCEDYDLSARLKKIGRLLCDNRIVAVHHREPATVGDFFRKEKWRGKSNLSGVMSHGLQWNEMPSLILPFIHCLFALSFMLCVIALFVNGKECLHYAIIIFLIWQSPFMVLACYKNRSVRPVYVFQLYLLINVYFFARGLAVFRL